MQHPEQQQHTQQHAQNHMQHIYTFRAQQEALLNTAAGGNLASGKWSWASGELGLTSIWVWTCIVARG